MVTVDQIFSALSQKINNLIVAAELASGEEIANVYCYREGEGYHVIYNTWDLPDEDKAENSRLVPANRGQ